MTNRSPSKVFSHAVQQSAKKASYEKKHKATERVKKQRRMRKYLQKYETAQVRKAYSRHDGGLSPDDIDDDISPEHLAELKKGYYKTKVIVTSERAKEIEHETREQADSPE